MNSKGTGISYIGLCLLGFLLFQCTSDRDESKKKLFLLYLFNQVAQEAQNACGIQFVSVDGSTVVVQNVEKAPLTNNLSKNQWQEVKTATIRYDGIIFYDLAVIKTNLKKDEKVELNFSISSLSFIYSFQGDKPCPVRIQDFPAETDALSTAILSSETVTLTSKSTDTYTIGIKKYNEDNKVTAIIK